ncbi:signal peptidase I [Halobellus marinus]|uniref:signal peptidase I n=1 Tax=Halobellus TaxID=1073986 RepID=UPI0028B0605E|nr:signal peptidase I [Halobellus sp. DFY28]
MNYSRALKRVGAFALLLVVASFALQAFPGLVGADYAFTVLSGSMEPAIGTGSVVFVAEVPADQVQEQDVITYRDDGGYLITHRVIEKHQADDSLRFVTKGDANDAPDGEPVYRGDLVGTVLFSIPFIGYVVAFGNTTAGYLILVLLPVMLFIFNEIWELWRAGTRKEEHS